MLDSLLNRVEATFPTATWRTVEEAHWRGVMASFCRELGIYSRYLLGAASAVVANRVFADSRTGMNYMLEPFLEVCEYALSPDAGYYSRFNKTIPAPDNPTGPRAKGISVELKLMRGHDRGPKTREIQPACLIIAFQIRGERERSAFLELLNDHRRSIERLLQPVQDMAFFTSCVFENVERSKKKSAFAQLCLYAQNDVDDESSFELSVCFTGNSPIESQIVAVTRFLALYDLAFGYCQRKPQRDRIDSYRAMFELEP